MAVGYDRIAREIAFTLEKKSEKIFENIFLNNGVLAALGANGRVKVIRGGNRFDEIVHLGENSTVGHRSKYTVIPTDRQDNFQTAYYGQAVVDGTSNINLVEVDQNAGEAKIFDMAENLVEEAQRTFPNVVGDALMATTPATTDPESIVNTVEATAFGSQTSTTGGLVRSSYASEPGAWQNQYSSSAITDLGAASGIAELTKFLWTCSPGGSGISEQPDVGITTNGVFAKMSGGQDVLRRYSTSDKMIKLGFDSQAPFVTWEGNEVCFANTIHSAKAKRMNSRKPRTGNLEPSVQSTKVQRLLEHSDMLNNQISVLPEREEIVQSQ